MKNWLPILLLMIYLPNKSLTCSFGCLKCTQDSECLVCDIENFYYLLDNKCIHFRPDFCLFASNINECLICKAGFYLDRGRCLRTSSIFQNCFQANIKECVICNNGYYVYKGKCVQITNIISNCDVQINEFQCQKCENGFYLNEESNLCLSKDQLSMTNNCALMSQLDCEEYSQNYENYYLNQKFLNQNLKDNFFQKIFRKTKNSIDFKLFKIYEQIVISRKENIFKINFLAKSLQYINKILNLSPSCDLFITQNRDYQKSYEDLKSSGASPKNKLSNFATEIFEENETKFSSLKMKLCEKDFIIQQPNCLEYLNNTECLECQTGFYLESNECKPQQNFTNCKVYSKSLLQTCEICEDGFYASGNSCAPRSVSIPNCISFDPKSEKCIGCEFNYQLTSNQLLCIELPKNCKKIDEVSKRCMTCKPYFYLDISYFCFMPSVRIQNCLVYKDSVNCLGCEDGFYLSENKCLPLSFTSSLNSHCESFDFLDGKRSCTKCFNGYFPIKTENICIKKSSFITHCSEYNSNDNCSTCVSGFYQNNGKCYKISEPICKKNSPNRNICYECNFEDSFQVPNNLEVDNKCISLQPIIKQMCSSINLDLSSSSFPCDSCFNPFLIYKKDISHHPFCVANFQINEVDKIIQESCLLFELDQNNLTMCKKCKINPKTNKQMVLFKGRCINDCPSSTMIIKTYDFASKSWYTCQERNDDKLMNCENCQCRKYNEGIYVDSFLKLTDIDNSKKYKFEEMNNYLLTKTQDSQLVNNHLFCVECPEGYKPVLNFDESEVTFKTYSKFDYRPQRHLTYFYNNDKSYFSEFNYIPQINECAPYNIDIYERLPENHSIIVKDIYNIYLKVDYSIFFNTMKEVTINNFDFCKAVKTGENDKIGCFSCEFGYNGYIYNSEDMQMNYIPECFYFYECKSEIYYRNVTNNTHSPDLYYKASCHQCKSLEEIVSITTFPMNYESLYENFDPRIYDVNLTTMSLNFCHKVGILDNNSDFPKNCAIQEVLFTLLKSFDKTSPQQNNPVCRICKPKYKPTYYLRDVDKMNYVLTCELIQNCEFSDEFNKCSKCKKGYVLKYEPNSALSLKEECVLNTVENCEISHNDSACLKCFDGYVVSNIGGSDYCIKERNDYCIEINDSSQDPFASGCNKCLGGFFSTYLPYEKLNLCYDSNQKIINNCLSINSDMKCDQCFPNYFPIENSLTCIQSTIQNCILYQDQNNCKKCKEKFYLSNNKCLSGNINNCLFYNSKNQCSECESNFFLYKMGSFTICLNENSLIPNCEFYTIDDSTFPPKYICDRCEDSYSLSDDFNIVQCKEFEVDSLCQEFDDSNVQLGSSSPSLPTCRKCVEEAFMTTSPSSFLTSSNCVRRNYFPIYNCSEYETDSDSCKICKKGFFTNFNGKECIENNFQIKNCLMYDKNLKCSICMSGFYFDEATSKSCVNLTSPLANCFLHLSAEECFVCEANHLLKEGKCEVVDMYDENTKNIICEDIRLNSGLKSLNLKNKLLINSCHKNLVDNCFEYDKFGKCQRCNQNYFLTEYFVCEEVTRPIKHCEFYSSSDMCMVCESHFVLTKDKRFCLRGEISNDQFNVKNCSKLIQRDYCVLCEPGFQLDNQTDKCTWAVKDEKCQLFDLDNKCLLCSSFYQMDSSGLCHLNQNIIEINETIKIEEE